MVSVTENPGSAAAVGRFTIVPISRLRPGSVLQFPIYDDRAERDVLLLAAGTRVTSRLVERIQARGIRHVRVSLADLQRMRPGLRVSSNDSPAAPPTTTKSFGKLLTPDSFVHKVTRHGSSKYNPATARKFAAGYRQSLRQVESLFTGLAAGAMRDASEFAAISSTSLLQITEDLDLFARMGISPAADQYPWRHSLQTAMLAMSLATVMGYKRNELIELGIGCLVHDAGMLRLDPELLRTDKVLNEVQFLEITKHPSITFEMLKDLPDVPIGARLVAYQMHERCDGSGYPRKRTGAQIHPYSKIAAVADVFVALLSPRAHRPAMLPYHAMEEVLQGAKRGLYDPAAVRALLYTVSLFPIGSHVRLSNGRVGQVVRSNRENFARPVVEVWAADAPSARETIDLAQTPGLSIADVLSELPHGPQPTASEPAVPNDADNAEPAP